jgi:hypothetical protein
MSLRRAALRRLHRQRRATLSDAKIRLRAQKEVAFPVASDGQLIDKECFLGDFPEIKNVPRIKRRQLTFRFAIAVEHMYFIP